MSDDAPDLLQDKTVAVLGGTGPQGRGLARRWAAAGLPVVIGSRSSERATETAERLAEATGGQVTGADLASWRSNFGPSATGDADGDNDTDGADFLIWQRELGSGVGGLGASAAIPEPSGVLLMMLAAASIPMVSARRRSIRRR